jgi:hypothetical protein
LKLRSVKCLSLDLKFDEATLNDFADVGAMILTEGLAGDKEFLPEMFKAELVGEFGDAVLPEFDEIYRRSWDKRNEWLSDERFTRTKERLDKKYKADLSDDEVLEILGQEKEKAQIQASDRSPP